MLILFAEVPLVLATEKKWSLIDRTIHGFHLVVFLDKVWLIRLDNFSKTELKKRPLAGICVLRGPITLYEIYHKKTRILIDTITYLILK